MTTRTIVRTLRKLSHIPKWLVAAVFTLVFLVSMRVQFNPDLTFIFAILSASIWSLVITNFPPKLKRKSVQLVASGVMGIVAIWATIKLNAIAKAVFPIADSDLVVASIVGFLWILTMFSAILSLLAILITIAEFSFGVIRKHRLDARFLAAVSPRGILKTIRRPR